MAGVFLILKHNACSRQNERLRVANRSEMVQVSKARGNSYHETVRLSTKPRGLFFWDIADEGSATGEAHEPLYLAKTFNRILHTRPDDVAGEHEPARHPPPAASRRSAGPISARAAQLGPALPTSAAAAWL